MGYCLERWETFSQADNEGVVGPGQDVLLAQHMLQLLQPEHLYLPQRLEGQVGAALLVPHQLHSREGAAPCTSMSVGVLQ